MATMLLVPFSQRTSGFLGNLCIVGILRDAQDDVHYWQASQLSGFSSEQAIAADASIGF